MAQQTDSQLGTQKETIKTETVANANTATRIGTLFENMIDSKINNDKIVDEDNFASNSATLIPSQQSVKAYVDNLTQDASETVKGKVELATTAETVTGTDTVPATTPAGVKAAIDALIAAAPGALNTLDELAAALGDDANFATTVTNSLAAKQALVNSATSLTDAATIDLTAIKHTLSSSSATRTFTISYTGDDITLEVTLSNTAATYTFPASSLCISEGVASGNNTLALSGVSGDKYIIGIKKIGSAYYVASKNFGQ